MNDRHITDKQDSLVSTKLDVEALVEKHRIKNAALANPDLPYEFVAQCLASVEEVNNGQITPYKRRTKSVS